MLQYYSIILPLCLLCLACLGLGSVILKPLARYLPALPIWGRACLAYFLGQGLLSSGLLLVAVSGYFIKDVLLAVLAPLALAGLWYLNTTARQWLEAAKKFFAVIRHGRFLWQFNTALLALLLMAGVSGLFITNFGGDAIAFYFAIAKYISELHRLIPMPGYEEFTGVGLYAETLIASLMSLGMPNISPRLYSWLNFLPILVLLYAVSRHCSLSRRAGMITLIVAATSTAVLNLWSDGKTDLFALGPGLAAVLCALLVREERGRLVLLLLTGYLAGIACVMKLTYAVALLPIAGICVAWGDILDILGFLRYGEGKKMAAATARCLFAALMCALGFTLAFAPHAYKNLQLFNTIVGIKSEYGYWYSLATIRRLLLTYPLALTYGNYWAQHGNLSSIMLAFAPFLFWLPGPNVWRNSRLAALSMGALTAMVCWMVIYPSYFMPRYFFVTLLCLGIPVAQAAMTISISSRTLAVAIPLILAFVLITCLQEARQLGMIRLNPTIFTNYPFSDDEECRLAGFTSFYCRAHKAINAKANQNDRVFVIAYRYWLRGDLLISASKFKENYSADGFWKTLEDGKFRFIQYDSPLAALIPREKLLSPPEHIKLHEIYREEGLITAYEVEYLKKP
ncbi:MAG: hypothetical protein HQK55_00210 [Deltaproteobacteria bacterium]|nr:hypothetical protein [Deltaproteobacteria bacterium]